LKNILRAVEAPNQDSIQLSWSPPRKEKITGYTISYKMTDQSEWTYEEVLGDALSCPIANTVPGAIYIFKISAKNEKGSGPDSDEFLLPTGQNIDKASV
jgi:hypothetical protein